MQRLNGRLVTGGGRLQESTEPQEASSEKRSNPPPPSRVGGTAIYGLCAAVKGMVFKQFTKGQGI